MTKDRQYDLQYRLVDYAVEIESACCNLLMTRWVAPRRGRNGDRT